MMTGLLKSLMCEAVFFFLIRLCMYLLLKDCRQSEREMKSSLALVEAAFNKKKTLLTGKLYFN